MNGTAVVVLSLCGSHAWDVCGHILSEDSDSLCVYLLSCVVAGKADGQHDHLCMPLAQVADFAGWSSRWFIG